MSVPVLSDGLLPLEGILSPNSLRVNELTLPWLDVAVQVRNQLVFFVTHSRSEVGDTHICLLGPPDEDGEQFKTHLLNDFSDHSSRRHILHCPLTAGLTVESGRGPWTACRGHPTLWECRRLPEGSG